MAQPEQIVLERKKKIKKNLGIGSIAIAAIFLFLPDMAIYDLLPDVIGYIILLLGISQLRDLNDYFGDAYERFYKVAWLAAVRYLSFFLVLGMVTPQEQPDTMLLLTFVFGVFDFIWVLPAWKDLFDGFSYLAARCDGAAFELKTRPPKTVRRTNRKKGLEKGMTIEQKPINRTEYLRRTTLFFVGFKAVLTALPEFAALTADVEVSTVFRLYDYIGLFRAIAMLAMLVFGVIWLVRVIGFVRAVKRDRPLIEFYREKYRTEVLTKGHLFTHRHLRSALLVASIAMVFRMDFRLDSLHVFPDALLAALLIVAVLLLGKHVGARGRFFVSAGVFAVVSAGVNLFEYYFSYNYSITSIQTDEAAYQMHVYLQIAKTAEQVLFVLMMVFFFALLRHVIRTYTGFSVTPVETRDPGEKIRTIHKELEKGMIPAFVLMLLSAVSKILMVVLLLYRRTGLELDWLPLADTLIAGVFAIFMIRSIRAIYAQVEYRFMLL